MSPVPVFSATRRRWLAAGLFLLAARGVFACTVTTAGVNFGAYDPFGASSLNGAGTITVDCLSSYTLTLSAGNGSYASRTLVNGANVLNYNLYIDSARTLVWGDGNGATGSVSGSGGASPMDHSVYGHIPGQQNLPAGIYSDSIVVTLSF